MEVDIFTEESRRNLITRACLYPQLKKSWFIESNLSKAAVGAPKMLQSRKNSSGDLSGTEDTYI